MIKEKKRGFYLIYIIFLVCISLLLISSVSAGFFDWLKKITGEATQTVRLNITVGVPQIIKVYYVASVTPQTALSATNVTINFSVYSPSGAANLNHTSAQANVSKTGDDTRQNSSCKRIADAGDYANYTCRIVMWWWDGSGTWNIGAYIKDNQTNAAQNITATFSLDSSAGFAAGPSPLIWPGLAAGATNQTSNNDPYVLNNTGNTDISTGNIQINATNLRGETTSSLALWAGNFSVAPFNGSIPPTECNATASTMSRSAYTNITLASLPAGNFTKNYENATSGQEQLYFCVKFAGSELTTQAYSSANETEGDWTVLIPG